MWQGRVEVVIEAATTWWWPRKFKQLNKDIGNILSVQGHQVDVYAQGGRAR